MPRLSPHLLRTAQRIDWRLPWLLPECRDLDSARNELRWMKEAVDGQYAQQQGHKDFRSQDSHQRKAKNRLEQFIQRRARHEPLQYILGTTPFGDLELKCEHGVLIPRTDTETWVSKLGSDVQQWRKARCNDERPLRIADFCTGSGCISLLLHSLLRPSMVTDSSSDAARTIEIHAFDVSQQALALSRYNLQHNVNLQTLHPSAKDDIFFHTLDVLALGRMNSTMIQDILASMTNHTSTDPASATDPTPLFDIIVSNPPYISPKSFRSLSPSVAKYEPDLALVPPPLPQESTAASAHPYHADASSALDAMRADQFYPALTRIAFACDAKLLALEIGDREQALRVIEACKDIYRLHRRSPLSATPGSISDSEDLGDELDARFEVWGDCGTAHALADFKQENDAGEFRARAVVMCLDDGRV